MSGEMPWCPPGRYPTGSVSRTRHADPVPPWGLRVVNVSSYPPARPKAANEAVYIGENPARKRITPMERQCEA
jgi:hypothetical protein